MCFKWAGRGRLCQQHSPPLVLISFTSSKLDPMWLTVSEDPHGRIRYHQDLYPRGTRRSQNGCPSFPEPVYSSYPSYSSGRYTVDLEREEYDNVNPDSPIPQYYYHHTNYCSPGTSSSSNYEEEYPIPVDSRDSSSIYRDNSSIYRESASIYRENYPIYHSSSIMTRYSEEPRREPVVPSPDYSPPVNRVRFLDQELYSNGYSTYRKPKQSYGTIDSRRRGAESQTKNDYQRRLQTSASDADLSRYSVKSRSSSVPFTDGKGSSLKQARRFLKERIFNSVAARETRAPVSASTVFSNVPPPPSSYSNGVTPVGTIAPHVEKTPVTSGGSFFNRKKKKDKKPRIRKEDISNPTNFQHKAHVGWDQDSGFSNNVDSDPMDESIKEIIRAAGQDPNNLSKKTIKFVYDFIERYEDTSVASPGPAQFSRQQAPPPPVPLSQPISQWNTPPPAPPSRGASYQSSAPPSRPPPPPPSTGKFNSRPLPQVPSIPDNVRPAGMPPPPPPMGSVAPMGGSIPPPPPPPPPISSSAPAPPPPPPAFSNSSAPAPPSSTRSAMPAPQSGRGDLLAQIQAGKQLRSVAKAEESKSTGGSDSRDDVMAQIRLGANLKHVDQAAEQEKRKSGPALAEMGGIAGALAKALEERRMNMCIDSSDDEEESDEKNEWSD